MRKLKCLLLMHSCGVGCVIVCLALFDRTPDCDGRTDGQIQEFHSMYSALV